MHMMSQACNFMHGFASVFLVDILHLFSYFQFNADIPNLLALICCGKMHLIDNVHSIFHKATGCIKEASAIYVFLFMQCFTLDLSI